MEKAGGKKSPKKVMAVVKSLVEIKGTLYLCIPKLVVRQCGLQAGRIAAIIAGEQVLTVFFPGDPPPAL